MITWKRPAIASFVLLFAAFAELGLMATRQSTSAVQTERNVYLGFDRNEYPGDAALPILRKSFSFAGYWLTAPPNTSENTWAGKRDAMNKQGFGFLLLARGRSASIIQSDTAANGIADAREAASNAAREGFVKGSTIFLDIEEGGRLPPQFHTYLRSWIDELTRLGFKAGVYCSGMPVNDGDSRTIVTSDDIRSNIGKRNVAFWVVNDSCPPSPGCTSTGLPGPTRSGVGYATAWQFVRSPRSKETALACAGYAKDDNCYTALDTAHRWHLDLEVANSENPSGPR